MQGSMSQGQGPQPTSPLAMLKGLNLSADQKSKLAGPEEGVPAAAQRREAF